MPNVDLPIPNVDEGIVRPMVADLIKQLQTYLHLEHLGNVHYLDDAGGAKSANSAVGEEGSYARFEGKQRLWVEVEEDYNQEGWASTVVERLEHRAVFEDPGLQIAITPAYVPSDLTIKLRYVTPQRDDARKWRDNLARRLVRLQEMIQHTVTFNMSLPDQVWGFLEDVYVLREGKAPYGEEIDQYLKNHSDPDLTIVSESSGTKRNLVFRRRMARINARFDVSPLPERPNFDQSKGLWECNLTYKLTFDRPFAVVVRYPIMIHNEFLPSQYIVPVNMMPDMRDRAKKLSDSMRAFSQFEAYHINGLNCSQDAFIQVPSIDDFVVPIVPKSTCTYFLGMVKLDTIRPVSLFNMGELGDVMIDEDILEFIREVEYEWMNRPYGSFLGMNVYRGNNLMHPSTISCTQGLDIVPNEDFNLREIYRVRLNLVVDPTLLPFAAIERLNRYPKALVKIVAAINEALRYNVDLQQSMSLRPLEPWMLSKLWWILNGIGNLPQTAIGRTADTGRSRDTYTIPDRAWDHLQRGAGGMRTVQIHNVLVKQKD